METIRQETPHNGSPLRERLFRDADRVSEQDIEGLEETLPKKLQAGELRDVDRVSWLGGMVERVRTLFAMIRDREFEIPGKTKALVAAGLLYFVLPTDFTPDFIPGVGYLDDALVLNILWKLVSEQIERYQALIAGRAGVGSVDDSDGEGAV